MNKTIPFVQRHAHPIPRHGYTTAISSRYEGWAGLSDPDTYNIASRSALQLNQDICRKYDKQFDQKMQELQQQYENR